MNERSENFKTGFDMNTIQKWQRQKSKSRRELQAGTTLDRRPWG
jgi:hypothetical protein